MKGILLLAFLLPTTFIQAQLKMLLQENFHDNHLGWYENEDERHTIRVKDGYYEMIIPENIGMTYIYPPMDVAKDFSLEANFIQTDGDIKSSFGFIWGYDEESSFNNFLISPNGYLNVFSTDKLRTDAKDWVKIEHIKASGQPNHLKFVQQSGKLHFLVNGHEVLSIKALPWYGKTVGFLCKAKTNLRIDNFLIYSDLNINLPVDLQSGLVKENLGPEINTEYDEVTPKISVDGKTIYFSRKKNPGNIGGDNDDSDVWFSTSTDGVTWSPSQNVGKPVNTEGINNIVSVSQDNNTMIMVASNDFDVFTRAATGWAAAGTLGIPHENESDYFEASQSADGKTVLFSARNKGSLFYSDKTSERDIFISRKGNNGIWSAPFNLGPNINTSGNEMSPFLAPDGRTLYFASDGHPGYGSSDIFMSKRLDDTWTNWSVPVNLGPEINTFGYEAYYTVPASGDVAYMCTSERSYGRFDLVRIRLPEAVQPEPVVLVTGRALHAKTKTPVKAKIVFENIETGVEAGEAISNSQSGEYQIALPYGVNYGLFAKAKGYISVNENLSLLYLNRYQVINKDLYLIPIEVGEAIQLNNVFFEQGRPVLNHESYSELDRLVTIMKENSGMEIELSGHTDNIGNPRSLVVLSQERVAAVKNYLVSKGITSNRISGKGYGASKPLVKNDSEEHRKMNRRVEFKITRK